MRISWSVIAVSLVISLIILSSGGSISAGECPAGDPCKSYLVQVHPASAKGENPYCCSPEPGHPDPDTEIGSYAAAGPGGSCEDGWIVCYQKLTITPERNACVNGTDEVTGKCCKFSPIHTYLLELPMQCIACYREEKPDGTWKAVCALLYPLPADPDCDPVLIAQQIGQPHNNWTAPSCP